jgi:hypothetical protein
MACEKYLNKECKGDFWCGRCPLYEYENGYQCIPTYAEEFAMKAQQEFFKQFNRCLKEGRREEAIGYYSSIQILENLLRGVFFTND